MATGMIGELDAEIGYFAEVSSTAFTTEGNTRELVLVDVGSISLGLTKDQALKLVRMILDATDLLDLPPSPPVEAED